MKGKNGLENTEDRGWGGGGGRKDVPVNYGEQRVCGDPTSARRAS